MRLILGVGLAGLLAGLTSLETARWRSDSSLWCAAVTQAATPRARNNCALALMRDGGYAAALPLLTQAAAQVDASPRPRPALRMAVRSNLAIAYGSLRRTEDARLVLATLDPTDPRTQWLQTWLDP